MTPLSLDARRRALAKEHRAWRDAYGLAVLDARLMRRALAAVQATEELARQRIDALEQALQRAGEPAQEESHGE